MAAVTQVRILVSAVSHTVVAEMLLLESVNFILLHSSHNYFAKVGQLCEKQDEIKKVKIKFHQNINLM